MRKLEQEERQRQWLAKHCPPHPRLPDPTCTVCGAQMPYVVTYDRWRAPLFLCHEHLPDWAAYELENGPDDRMCNLYSVTTNQEAIRDLARYTRDMVGNMPPIPAVFPDRMAPVVRTAPDGVRELVLMRWGFPPRPPFPGSKTNNRPITNVRNTSSRYWAPWLKNPARRCLVPVTSFAEPDNNQGPKSIWTWFARDESRPLMFFAGLWREWDGRRGTKADPVTGTHLLFSFLTTDASHDVAPVHSDATPVCLFTEDEREMWMNAPVEMALSLQRPPAPGALRVVATDTKQDG